MDSWINLLDQASLAAVGQNLVTGQDGSLAGFHEQVVASARQLLSQIEPMRSAAKGEGGKLHNIVSVLHNNSLLVSFISLYIVLVISVLIVIISFNI